MNFDVSNKGFYGEFGGAYIPEMLYANVEELRERYLSILQSETFQTEFTELLRDYAGRPSPLFHAKRLSEKTGASVWLKREDLLHTGAHKINNTVGQILMARQLGKTRIIAETSMELQQLPYVHLPACNALFTWEILMLQDSSPM